MYKEALNWKKKDSANKRTVVKMKKRLSNREKCLKKRQGILKRHTICTASGDCKKEKTKQHKQNPNQNGDGTQ